LHRIDAIDYFVAEHHVERPFNKRHRDGGDQQMPQRRGEDTGSGK
jgi:hypothetical protein